MPDYLNLYHHLPHSLKVAAASVKGYELRRLRYGKNIEELVAEASSRNGWAESQWKEWREARLDFILQRAATKVPYYQDQWAKIKRRNPRLTWRYLDNWPILDKETVRNTPRAFVAEGINIKNLYVDHTSGTTGRPTLIYESRETVQQWYALLEARLRRCYGVSYKDRWAMFGGQKVISLGSASPPFWVMNYGLNQLYFSIFHIKKNTAKDYVEALRRFSPTHLIVYPSILGVLSSYIKELGLTPSGIKVIFCNSEKVTDTHRRLIESAFRCRVIDTYGMAELTCAGSECSAGVMHFWPEVGYLEVFDSQSKSFIKDSETGGEFVMTSLINTDMPLIRYKNGDVGSLPVWNNSCSCGMSLPRLGSVQGRSNDLIKTPDGRQLYILDSLFNGLDIVEAQVIQENLRSFTINVVPVNKKNANPADLDKQMIDRLTPYLRDGEISVNQVEAIPRNSNGKFRPFISKIA